MATDRMAVTWYGSIADTATAMRFAGGLEGGARVVIDVPENQVGAALGLVALRGRPLKITVELATWEDGEARGAQDDEAAEDAVIDDVFGPVTRAGVG